MDDRIRQIFADAQSITLAPEEKAALRMQVHAHLCLNLSSVEKAECRQRLLFAIRRDVPRAESSFFSRIVHIFNVPALAGAFLLIGATGSLAAAAENSLPGDFLYPAKLSVMEPIIASLQLTQEAKASWALRVMERRLEEGESDEGELSEEAEAALAARIRSSAKAAEHSAAAVAGSEQAEKMRQQMRLSLEVHERQLIRMAERKPSKYLLSAVREIRKGRGELTDVTSSSQSSTAHAKVRAAKSSTEMSITIAPVVPAIHSSEESSIGSSARGKKSSSVQSEAQASVSSEPISSPELPTVPPVDPPVTPPVTVPQLPPVLP